MNEGFERVTAWLAARGHPHKPVALPVADVVQTVPSPCTGVCQIDPDVGLCRGCCRTLDEIAAWPGLDDDARRALRLELDARRKAHPGFPSPSA